MRKKKKKSAQCRTRRLRMLLVQLVLGVMLARMAPPMRENFPKARKELAPVPPMVAAVGL